MAEFPLRPMDAVAALYAEGNSDLAEAIVAGISRVVFGEVAMAPAGLLQRLFSRVTHRVLKWTTTRRQPGDTAGGTSTYRNPILERSRHPYARALLTSSSEEEESIVEGGDHMNGPYMMIVPEILKLGTMWDRIFLNSVQGKDVQLRFIWETRATYEAARTRLEKGGAVRLKAVAAGTGLSMILAFDRLIRDGFDAARIIARIADREKTNTEKTRRILAKLSTTRGAVGSISAETEDLFADQSEANPEAPYDVVTSVGILEYLQGYTCDTTERSLGLQQPEEAATAKHLVERLAKMTAEGGSLIINTYRPQASTRILEVFGKRFDYRTKDNVRELLATAHFEARQVVGSGNIYDIKVYEKCSP